MELDLRKQKILSAVIENYIATGEPSSSKALQNDTDLNVSSATIRNELQYLVENGYLLQPHTSAGRIPTVKGYRYYIQNICEKDNLSERLKENIERAIISGANTPESILEKASMVLSELTSCACILTTPPSGEARVHKIKFVATGRHTAMAVLITSNGVVKSKLFRCEFVVTPELLTMFDKTINKRFVGVKLNEVNKVFIQSVASTLGEVALFIPDALLAVYEAIKAAMISSVKISGETNLLFIEGYSIFSARDVLRFLSDTEGISEFLNNNKDTKVFLGNESNKEELKDSALITTRYEIANEKAGSIAIVGPLRLDYKKIIPEIEYVAQCVSQAISELLDIQRR